MTILTILAIILAVAFILVATTTIAYEVLPMSKTPEWLEDLHYLIWR